MGAPRTESPDRRASLFHDEPGRGHGIDRKRDPVNLPVPGHVHGPAELDLVAAGRRDLDGRLLPRGLDEDRDGTAIERGRDLLGPSDRDMPGRHRFRVVAKNEFAPHLGLLVCRPRDVMGRRAQEDLRTGPRDRRPGKLAEMFEVALPEDHSRRIPRRIDGPFVRHEHRDRQLRLTHGPGPILRYDQQQEKHGDGSEARADASLIVPTRASQDGLIIRVP